MTAWLQSFQTEFPDAAIDTAALDACVISGVCPACVYAPPDAERAAAAIRYSAENKIPVVPFGGGTQQGIGQPPPEALVIHTQHLNRLIHHEPGDMVATAQAGMTFGAFQRALGERGQWLPLDGQENSTLGGMIATNCYGPLAEQHGTLRDMVLGMTVVNGDGVIRKCGGKVVKNVTGYALDKLYIGSLGTLGLITEVTFKLLPTDRTYNTTYESHPNTLRYWCLQNQQAAVRELLAQVSPSVPAWMGLGFAIELPGLTAQSSAQLAQKLVELRVNFRFENVTGFRLAEPFGPPRPEWALMKQIKAALDPQNILNPGRFVV